MEIVPSAFIIYLTFRPPIKNQEIRKRHRINGSDRNRKKLQILLEKVVKKKKAIRKDYS